MKNQRQKHIQSLVVPAHSVTPKPPCKKQAGWLGKRLCKAAGWANLYLSVNTEVVQEKWELVVNLHSVASTLGIGGK